MLQHNYLRRLDMKLRVNTTYVHLNLGTVQSVAEWLPVIEVFDIFFTGGSDYMNMQSRQHIAKNSRTTIGRGRGSGRSSSGRRCDLLFVRGYRTEQETHSDSNAVSQGWELGLHPPPKILRVSADVFEQLANAT